MDENPRLPANSTGLPGPDLAGASLLGLSVHSPIALKHSMDGVDSQLTFCAQTASSCESRVLASGSASLRLFQSKPLKARTGNRRVLLMLDGWCQLSCAACCLRISQPGSGNRNCQAVGLGMGCDLGLVFGPELLGGGLLDAETCVWIDAEKAIFSSPLVVRRLIRAWIGAATAPICARRWGGGSTFTVYLPADVADKERRVPLTDRLTA